VSRNEQDPLHHLLAEGVDLIDQVPEWDVADRSLAGFRVGGFDDETMKYTEPTQVACRRCGTAQEFTWRDDGGADRTESLDVLTAWAAGHARHCNAP